MYNRHASICGARHAVLWTDCEHGVAPVDGQPTLHHARLYTRSFSNERLWTGSLRRVTPSLRDARVCADLWKVEKTSDADIGR